MYKRASVTARFVLSGKLEFYGCIVTVGACVRSFIHDASLPYVIRCVCVCVCVCV